MIKFSHDNSLKQEVFYEFVLKFYLLCNFPKNWFEFIFLCPLAFYLPNISVLCWNDGITFFLCLHCHKVWEGEQIIPLILFTATTCLMLDQRLNSPDHTIPLFPGGKDIFCFKHIHRHLVLRNVGKCYLFPTGSPGLYLQVQSNIALLHMPSQVAGLSGTCQELTPLWGKFALVFLFLKRKFWLFCEKNNSCLFLLLWGSLYASYSNTNLGSLPHENKHYSWYAQNSKNGYCNWRKDKKVSLGLVGVVQLCELKDNTISQSHPKWQTGNKLTLRSCPGTYCWGACADSAAMFVHRVIYWMFLAV